MDENGSPPAKRTRYSLRDTPARREHAEQQNRKALEKRKRAAKRSTKFDDLNDYCLLEIVKFLQPNDLLSAAHVNKRLNAVVKSHIHVKHKISFDENSGIRPDNVATRINLPLLELFLGVFGNDIKALSLHRRIFDATFDDFKSMFEVFTFIQKYCTTLERLTLNGFGTCGLNRTFFKRLKALTLVNCSVSRDWCKMVHLQELDLEQVIFRRWPKGADIPVQHFRQLKYVRLCDTNLTNADISRLINSNALIQRLSVVKSFETTVKFIDALPKLERLNEFEFKKQDGNPKLVSLKRLSSVINLKTLKFSLPNHSASVLLNGLVENGVAIEHLELSNGQFDDFAAENISKLARVQVLKFNDMLGLNATQLLQITRELKMLKQLQIKTSATISQNELVDMVKAANKLKCLKIDAPGYALDTGTYQALLATIQQRKKKAPLELMIYGKRKQLLVPNEMLTDQNEKWLVVKEMNRSNDRLDEDLTPKVGPAPPQYYYYSSDDDDYYYNRWY